MCRGQKCKEGRNTERDHGLFVAHTEPEAMNLCGKKCTKVSCGSNGQYGTNPLSKDSLVFQGFVGAFKLPQIPGKATLSCLLNTSSLRTLLSNLTKPRKQKTSGKNSNVERVLFSWITECYNNRVSTNGPLASTKGRKLQKEYNNGITELMRARLNFWRNV